MKVKVDPNICIGCGLCVSITPAVFEMNSEGKAQVKAQTDDVDLANRSIADCPVQAISSEE